jgi:hypothetical protein
MEGLSKEITLVCRNLVNVGARPGSRWCSVPLVCISASQPSSNAAAELYIIKSSINRQSTVHQIPWARSINSSVGLMLFMGSHTCIM